MKALITGASSGIGRDMARLLSQRGYDLILVARRKERLEDLKQSLKTNVQIICMDISKEENCFELYDKVKNEDIDILINNAGYGLFGKFEETDLENEISMLKVNIKALHILTKLFYKDFKQKDKGYILNVASSAGFMPGPLLSSYYASKAYVLRLSVALYEELRRDKSKVTISVLCPGPVKTEFDQVAGVSFSLKGLKSEYVAKYALNKMFNKKLIIVPGFSVKCAAIFRRLVPIKLLAKITYNVQKKKSD